MTRPLPERIPPGDGPGDAATTSPGTTGTARLDDDQIDRWADRIADDRGELPADLDPTERDRLLVAVRRRLRDRLVRHIARAVAARLHRDPGPRSETDSNA